MERRTLLKRSVVLLVGVLGIPAFRISTLFGSQEDPVENFVKKTIGQEFEIDPLSVMPHQNILELARKSLLLNGYDDPIGSDGFRDSDFLPVNLCIELEEKLQIELPDEVVDNPSTTVLDLIKECKAQMEYAG